MKKFPLAFIAATTLALGSTQPISRLIKAMFDIIFALMFLALLCLPMAMIALLIRLDGGPVLFVHERVGLGGRSFRCFKFRTMVTDSDRVLRELLASDPRARAEWAEKQKLTQDPRVTAIGRFMRATSLDELPQFFNILRLEMSLVGPRPIVRQEMERYGDDIALYCGTRPGLTGLWQVSGRSNTTYGRRVQLDSWYVRNWSVWLDITIMFKTIPVVIGRSGAG